ncbi:MAG: glycosyltransferase [Steroidobacteraceae bacterium]
MGDTQPFVALAVGLKQQGHAVRLAARPDFAPLAASYDIEFAPLGNPTSRCSGTKRWQPQSDRETC